MMIAQGMKPIMTVMMVLPQVKSRASCTATNQAEYQGYPGDDDNRTQDGR